MGKSIDNPGLRLTAARKWILRLLRDNPCRHLDAEEIHRLLARQGRSMNLATVYRTLDTLCRCGLIHRTHLLETHAHYEVRHPGEAHLLCLRCGRVVEDIRLLNGALRKAVERRVGRRLRVKDLTMEILGVCPECDAAVVGDGTMSPKGAKWKSPGRSPGM
jgi:Fe2+ or Zn2+ uptake regulation protein